MMKIPSFSKALSMLLLIGLGGWQLAACAPGEPQLVSASAARQTNPTATSVDMRELAGGNSRFALDLYQALRSQQGNLFLSPYSISLALAMTYAGARGETATQMADVLSFSLPQERLHPAFNALDLTLMPVQSAQEQKDEEDRFQLEIANALWGQQGFTFKPEFLELLATNYGAGMRLVDFVGQTEQARQTINRWVSDQTHEKIQELIPQGVLDAMSRLVLTNAVYFKARWQHSFEKSQTQDGPFYLLDGSQVQVPMMAQTEMYPYAQGEDYQAVELGYRGDATSMVILLPAPGKFDQFESSLDAQRLESILTSLKPEGMDLSMPRFRYEASFNLNQALTSLGMEAAFTPPSGSSGADFSGMDGKRDLYIGNVLHKAFVAVDEKGTEAAAATAVEMKLQAALITDLKLTIDRPFIFLIRDQDTGTLLFLGRVLNPQG